MGAARKRGATTKKKNHTAATARSAQEATAADVGRGGAAAAHVGGPPASREDAEPPRIQRMSWRRGVLTRGGGLGYGTAAVASAAVATSVLVACATTTLCDGLDVSSTGSSSAQAARTEQQLTALLRNRSHYLHTVAVRAEYPHDTSAFTQGLCVDVHHPSEQHRDHDNGAAFSMWESDGLYAKSRVRRVELATGASLEEIPNAPKHFGEGLTVVETPGDDVVDKVLLQLTWRERTMHEYALRPKLKHLRSVPQPLPREGWGAAYDAARGVVYLSDGSATIRTVRRAVDAKNSGAVTYARAAPDVVVRDARLGGAKIEGLNELEMVEGELWANIYPMRHARASNCVARVDPPTGRVLGWIDLSALFARQSRRVQAHRLNYVLNGIAYVPPSGVGGDPELYVTGKQWDYAYSVALAEADPPVDDHDPKVGVPASSSDDVEAAAAYVRRHCDLWLPPSGPGDEHLSGPPSAGRHAGRTAGAARQRRPPHGGHSS